MLKIYFSFINQLPTAEMLQGKLLTLPLQLQQKITAYNSPWDKALRISSKLLLRELIHRFGMGNEIGLDDLQLSKSNKPHFNNALYFSSAHSGKIAVCVACTESEVGIDIEEIKPIDLSLYEEYFTVEEWRKIKTSGDAVRNFLNAWTRKEAVLKAIGSGIDENLALFNAMKDTVTLNDTHYYLQTIPVWEGYVCHIASTTADQQVEIKAIKLFEE